MAGRNSNGPGGSMIMGMIVTVVVLYLLFNLMGWVFQILTWIAPVLFIIAFFINKDVVLDYFKGIWNRIKTNPLMGIAQGALTFFAFPFVSAFLFGKALLVNKVQKVTGQHPRKEDKFTEYEEVEDDNEDFLNLDDIKNYDTPKAQPKAEPQTRTDSRYDDLFE